MISEAEFQAALERALNASERATRVRRINSGDVVIEDGCGRRRRVRGAMKGTGDLVGFASPDGRHLEVEAKSARGKLSLAQRRRARALNAAGAVHVTVYAGEDIEESVYRALAQIDLAIDTARKERPCPKA